MKPKGLKGMDAQRLLGEWLRLEKWCVAMAGVRAKFQAQDLFGCLDALAFRLETEGEMAAFAEWKVWGIQITTSDSRSAKSDRRRKLEAVKWPYDWRISLVTHERVPNPANRVKSMHYWRIEDYNQGDVVKPWLKPIAVQFDYDLMCEIKERASDEKHEAEMDEIRARIAKQEASK